MRERHFGRE